MNQSSLLDKAVKAFDNKQYNLAMTTLEDVIENEEDNLKAWFHLANVYHLKGQLGKAVNAFQKVLELDPGHTDASISLSVILNDIGRYEEARKHFENANSTVKKDSNQGVFENSIDRKFSQKHYELGELYFSYNRFDEALFEYTKAQKLNKNNHEISIRIAKLYAKQGFVQKAFAELKSLKRNDPAYLPAKIALGLLHFSEGNVIEAQTEWNSILSFDPNHEEAKMYLGMAGNATETSLS